MLKHFDTDEIFLDHGRAWIILEYFFQGDIGITPGQLTDTDRSFAQALVIDAIDKSYAMSWIEANFRGNAKPHALAKTIIKELGKKALRDWFNNSDAKGWIRRVREKGEFPELYESVVFQTTRTWRSTWVNRVILGEFDGY
ncbi:hypothetical protein BH20ACI1_BH20ACI1_04050 [soil metagenome]